MTSKAFKRCEALIRKAVEHGFTHQISRHWIQVLIKKEIGADPRTLKNWTNNLEDFGFIKPMNAHVYKIDLTHVEGALTLALKNDRQKKLM